MKCPVCNHENGEAQFCERCGSNLAEAAVQADPVTQTDSATSDSDYTRWSSTQSPQTPASLDSAPPHSPSVHTSQQSTYESEHTTHNASAGDTQSNQWNNIVQNEKVQQAKEVSKQYLSYSLSVLARPYQTMKTVGDQHSLNGWITMALVAILTSTYFLITFGRLDIPGLFISGFIRPLLFAAIIQIAAIALIYAILKFEKITFRPKTLVAQFGTLLVPAVVTLILANLMVIISVSMAIGLLILSYIIVFVSLNTVLFHYPLNRTKATIDSVYSVLIANVVVFYILYKLLGDFIFGIIALILSPFGRL